MRNPFRRSKAITSTPAVLEAIRDGSFQPYPLLGGGARQRIQEAFTFAHSASLPWIYQNTPAVRTVIDTLTRNISQLPLRLYEEVDEANREPKPDHPAAMSMRYPSETVPADQFIRQLFQDFFVFDDAFALMGAAGNGRVSFNWMPAQMVQVLGNGLFTATGYRFWRQDGTFVDFAPEQVLHWHGENPFDPRVGISKLDTLRAVIAEDASLQQAIVELANAGMTEPIWVSRPLEAPPWSNEARKGFEEDMTNRLRRRNTTPPVIEEGMEMHSFGVSPKDAQMFEVRKWAIERVAAAYGVPLGMVGLADNLEQAQSQFYSDTLPPYLEAFTRMLNLRLLVREYNWTDGCFEFNLDEKHMGDDRLQALTAASGRPVLLTNEARAKLNLPPVDIGDELVTPLNVIVGENPKPTPTTMPVQDPNKPPQDGSYRSDQGSAAGPAEGVESDEERRAVAATSPGAPR
jgi:HK97 family phage portal protein